MRNFTFLSVCLGVLFVAPASAGDRAREHKYSSWHAGHVKASPVWVMPKATAPSNMVWDVPSMPGQVQVGQFSEADVCAGCHQDIHAQWKGSMMANSWKDPIFRAVYESYIIGSTTENTRLETAMCSRCHTPVGYLADEEARYLVGELSAPGKAGVYCDVCHSVSSSAGIGNGAFILNPDIPGTKYGPRQNSASPFHTGERSDLHIRSEFCGMCHDVAHARDSMPVESTFSEWRTSPYNTGDPQTSTHCQDCHMRQVSSPTDTAKTSLPDSPGFAAPDTMGGQRRSHIWQHWFVGGNAFSPGLLGNPPWAQMARERLATAATVKILPPGGAARPGGLLRLDVRVDNVGAGHFLPTGLTHVRQMWLHFLAKDGEGRVLYESGAVDDNGDLDAKAVVYRTVLAKDGTGREPTFFLPSAVQVLSDKRIRPKGYSVERYAFLVPESSRTAIEVVATLRYRSAPQSLVNQLLGKYSPTLPIFDMTAAKRTVPIGG